MDHEKQPLIDEPYRAARKRAELAFESVFVRWLLSVYKQRPPFKAISAAELVHRAHTRAWNPDLQPELKEVPRLPEISDSQLINLAQICRQYVKMDAVAFWLLLQRQGIPETDHWALTWEHSRSVLEEVRLRKWEYALDQIAPPFERPSALWWNGVVEGVTEFFRHDIDIELWSQPVGGRFASRLTQLYGQLMPAMSWETVAAEARVSRTQLFAIKDGRAKPTKQTKENLRDFFMKYLQRSLTFDLEET